MSNIELIKQLREETGGGVSDVKKALDEAGDDLDKAREILKKRGLEIAQKKSERVTGQGLIDSYVHLGKIGVIVEVNCETDFVSKNDEFKKFTHDLAVHVAASEAKTVEELIKDPHFKDESKTIGELLNAVIARTGENIIIKRFVKYRLGE